MFSPTFCLIAFVLIAGTGAQVCTRNFLLFEFKTRAPTNRVKYAFSQVDVIYSFKVYGTGHYLFVVEDKGDDRLKSLKLPRDAEDTAIATPLEPMQDFAKRVGVDIPGEELEPLNGTNLLFLERIWNADGLNRQQFTTILSTFITFSQTKTSLGKSRFMAVGEYPNKFIFFVERSNCVMGDVMLLNSDAFGGPGAIQTRIRRIHSI